MLMLKSPLQLHSAAQITTVNDQLNEKIRGNYQMLNLSISAQDLFHMTLQEPDIYVAMGNEQTMAVENNLINQNNLKIEAVNQFINRIMLLHTDQFTYQDEVYITSFLQKIGITDVASFVKQVTESIKKNELTQELVSRYFEAGRSLTYVVSNLLTQNKAKLPGQTQEEQKASQTANLHNIVFEHLHTAENSNTIYDYLVNFNAKHIISEQQAKLLPAIQQADTIHLYQLRQHVLQQSSPAIWESHNRYEEIAFEENEITQHNIMKNLSAAILSNLISNETYELRQQIKNHPAWINFTSALFQSSLDTVQRFERNQAEYHSHSQLTHVYEQNMTQLSEDELSLIEMLQDMDIKLYEPNMEQHNSFVNSTIMTLLKNQNLQQQVEAADRIQNMQLIQNYEKESSVLQFLQQQSAAYENIWNYYYQKCENYEESLSELHLQNIDIHALQMQHKQEVKLQQDELEQSFQNNQEIHDIQNIERNHSLNQNIQEAKHITNQTDNRKYDYTEENNITQKVLQDIQTETNETNLQQSYDIQQDALQLVYQSDNTEHHVQITNEEEYAQYLYRMNEQNIEMQKKLQQQNNNRTVVKKVMVDRKSAMRDMLKTLQQPEKVLEEIYQNSVRIEKPVSQEIEQYLRLADKETRTVYEDILGIERTTEEKTEQKTLETTVDTLQKIVEEITAQAETVQNTSPDSIKKMQNQERILVETIQNVMLRQQNIYKKEQETISEYVQSEVTDTIEKKPVLRHTESEILLPLQHIEKTLNQTVLPKMERKEEEKISLIHQQKEQINQEVVEEVLNQLEADRKVKIQNETTEQTEHIMVNQIHKTKKEIMTESQQIVENMIHRELQTNLHTISEQVYRDLEKRLLSERRRRGY